MVHLDNLFILVEKLSLLVENIFGYLVVIHLTLYAHRYLEDAIAPQVARRYLGNSAWSEIIIGGSNFGELLGSFFISIFMLIHFDTPLPWLRFSALIITYRLVYSILLSSSS